MSATLTSKNMNDTTGRIAWHEYAQKRNGANGAVGGELAGYHDKIVLVIPRGDMDRCLDAAIDRRQGVNAAKAFGTTVFFRYLLNGDAVVGHAPGTFVVFNSLNKDGVVQPDLHEIDATLIDVIIRHMTSEPSEPKNPLAKPTSTQRARLTKAFKDADATFDESEWTSTVERFTKLHGGDVDAFTDALRAYVTTKIAVVKPGKAVTTRTPRTTFGDFNNSPLAALIARAPTVDEKKNARADAKAMA